MKSKKTVMPRIAVTLALCIALLGLLALTVGAAENQKKLSTEALTNLIATAKTPQDHHKIAEYYKGESARLKKEANDHGQLGAAYKKNPMTSSSKWASSTVDHCEYISKSLNEAAGKMQAFAAEHEEMATNAKH